MNLYVDRNEHLVFQCKSRLPITLSTTWEYDKKLISSLQKFYWKYQEELLIQVPQSNDSQLESELKWRYIEVRVKCTLQDENITESVVWNYRLHTIRKISLIF